MHLESNCFSSSSKSPCPLTWWPPVSPFLPLSFFNFCQTPSQTLACLCSNPSISHTAKANIHAVAHQALYDQTTQHLPEVTSYWSCPPHPDSAIGISLVIFSHVKHAPPLRALACAIPSPWDITLDSPWLAPSSLRIFAQSSLY